MTTQLNQFFFPLAPGLSYHASDQLALRLLRPAALLAALAAHRRLFSLGSLHRQLQRAAQDPGLAQRQRWVGAILNGL